MGREATPEELAERMGMPEDKIRKVLKVRKNLFLWKPQSVMTMIHLGDFIGTPTLVTIRFCNRTARVATHEVVKV